MTHNLTSNATGARVEIEHPDGNVIRPTVVGDISIDRALNGNPTVTFDVPYNERWLHTDFTRAPARAWKDGKRLPVEEVESVVVSESTVTINLTGGIELRQSITQSYTQKEADIALKELVTNNTSYTEDVDSITGVDETRTVQNLDTTTEYQDGLNAISSEVPLTIENGKVTTQKSAFFGEAEGNGIFDPIIQDSTQASGSAPADGEGQEAQLGVVGEGAELNFTLDYTMPADNFTAWARLRQAPDADMGPGLEFKLSSDGVIYNLDESNTRWFDDSYTWFDAFNPDLSGDLPPGDYTLEFSLTSSTDDTGDLVFIDCLAVYDDRYGHTLDDTVSTNSNGNNYLDGPEPYPDAVPFTTITEPTAFNVLAGEFDGTFNNVSNNQQIELSNNGGDSYDVSGSNTSTVSGSFPEPGGSIKARVTLGRYDANTSVETTPATGDAPQTLDAHTLTIDANSRPLLLNKSYDDNLVDVLADIVSTSDYVFELVWDEANDTIQFASTRPGLRSSTASPPVESFSFEKRQDSLLRGAKITGASNQVRSEDFTANHGTSVELLNDNLIEAGETVFDEDTGEEYDINEDYEIDYERGRITTLADGDLSNGTQYQIAYRFKFVSEFTDESLPADYDTFVDTAPGLTTERACQQVAVFLVDNGSVPVNVADVTIPTDSFEFSLLDSLSLDQLPQAENTTEIWDYQNSPGSASLRLGSRDEIDDLFGDITSRLRSASKRV